RPVRPRRVVPDREAAHDQAEDEVQENQDLADDCHDPIPLRSGLTPYAGPATGSPEPSVGPTSTYRPSSPGERAGLCRGGWSVSRPSRTAPAPPSPVP